MEDHKISHMIRMEDLNHHQVLYAGRAADWLIECAFVAAVDARGDNRGVMFLKLEDFTFHKSILPGDVVCFKSKVSKVGKTSMEIIVEGTSMMTKEKHLDGICKFVSIDPETKKPYPHGIIL